MTRIILLTLAATLASSLTLHAQEKKDPPKHYTNSLGMKFVWIPPGSFMMGSPKEEKERRNDETQHKVALTKGFYLGVYAVTQEQWQEVMGNNPSFFKGMKDLPVDTVSWYDCQGFVKKLQGKDPDKKEYRLPTEAEWEYACRAGTTTPFHFGETISADQANYDGNFSYGNGKKGVGRWKTTPVGSFPANAWGLHDMHGNLWQWCQDRVGEYLSRDEEYPKNDVTDPQGPEKELNRVLRGGSWFSYPEDCRSAFRFRLVPGYRYNHCGIRLCFSYAGPSPVAKESKQPLAKPQPAAEPSAIMLMSPVERHVFQRQTNESGVVRIVLQGAPDGANTIIEARLTRVEKSRRGKDVDWTKLTLLPSKTGLAGRPQVRVKDKVALSTAELTAAAGGWYRLDIRAREGDKVIAEVSVAKVGIGEVFITAGQSNSSNWGEGTQEAKDDRVVYCDGEKFVPARDPLPNSYGDQRKGNHGNQYPFLGDRLAAAWDVPVAFRSATIAATQVSEWMPRNGDGDPGIGNRQFKNLVERAAAFGPRGARAVLWHQGEYDAIFGVPDELYRDILSHVIRRMRKDIGYEIDWFVAEAYKPKAQRMLWESKVCFPGPLSDDLRGKEFRFDGVHFGTKGLEALGQRWFEVLDKQYGARATRSAAEVKPAPLHKVISRGEAAGSYQAFPDACRLKNGDILAVFYAGYGHVSTPNAQWPKGGRICMVRSSDEGRTWSKPDILFDDELDNRDPHIAQMSDGALICSFFNAPGKSGVQIVRSLDGGKTWDQKSQSVVPEWYCSAPVREMPDGTYILGVYYENGGKAWGGVTRSTDRGKTWSDPIPIDKDSGVRLDAETDVVLLKDGSLYAALRGDGNVPMHFASSRDLGRTWSPVKNIGFRAHSPHFTRLSTGEILLTHRIPNTSLHVSRDEGRSWQGPYSIDAVGGAYPSTVELKDKSVLAIYYEEGTNSAIRAARFRLNPQGIEKLPLNAE